MVKIRAKVACVMVIAAAVAALSAPSPAWADAVQKAPLPLKERQLEAPTSQLTTFGSIGALYAVTYTWAYFAWYKGRQLTTELIVRDEGWFEPTTYAGGADKLGHMYSNYLLTRGTSALMQKGGWGPLPSSLLSTVLTMSFFTAIEFKDGYHKGFGFSWGDMTFNTAGNVLALAMINFPEVDERFSFRVEYLPTDLYVEKLIKEGVVDAAEDYSGQTYLLAWHLSSLEAVQRLPPLSWLQYTDLVVGFQALNYLPSPIDLTVLPEQRLFLGLSLNLQRVLDEAYPRRKTLAFKTTRVVSEFYGLPFTTPNPGAALSAHSIWSTDY